MLSGGGVLFVRQLAVLTSSGGCCVAISVTLRRRAVQHTHFAHGRCEAAASAGSAGIFVSAWTIAGRVLPIARLAGLVAFASLSCSGSSPELEKGIKRSAGSGAVIVRLMHRQKSGYVSPFAQRSKMTGGRVSIVLACLFCEGFCLLVAASDTPLKK